MVNMVTELVDFPGHDQKVDHKIQAIKAQEMMQKTCRFADKKLPRAIGLLCWDLGSSV
jgi:hypothetical protein